MTKAPTEQQSSEIMDALEFCDCGMPEEAITFILGGLELLAANELMPDDGRFGPLFLAWVDEKQAKEKAHFGSLGSAYFFWYWLNKEGYAEHGSSVPGWLTNEGKALLEKMRQTQRGPNG